VKKLLFLALVLDKARMTQVVISHSPVPTVFKEVFDLRLRKNTQEFLPPSLHTIYKESVQ
jgi:hypothetical protein